MSIVGILTGCGSTNNITGRTAPASTNTSNRAVTNIASNLLENATTNSVASTTSAIGTQTSENQTITWLTYTNDRFGFSVEYPSTWKMGPRSTDDDGRDFTTPSGVASFDNAYRSGVAKSDVMLLVVGTPNVVTGSGSGYNFKQMVAAFKKNLPNERKQQGFVSESYTVVPNEWIIDTVVTKDGVDGIHYRKMYTSLTTNQSISMVFPKSKLNVYLPIWDYVAKTFQPGNKNG